MDWSWSNDQDVCVNETTQAFIWQMPEFKPEEIQKIRKDWKSFMQTVPSPPKFSGRGIVYTSFPKVLTETLRSILFL